MAEDFLEGSQASECVLRDLWTPEQWDTQPSRPVLCPEPTCGPGQGRLPYKGPAGLCWVLQKDICPSLRDKRMPVEGC